MIKKREIGSIFITLTVVIVLIFSIPVHALRVNLKTDKYIYNNENKVTFEVSIDIQRNEIVPIKYLRLKINNDIVCKFYPDGSNSCGDFDITVINTGTEAAGERSAYGFGYEDEEYPSNDNVNYGFGYGFGEDPREREELKYEIEWDIENVPEGKYEAVLEAYAEDTDTEFTYVSNRPINFYVRKEKTQKPNEVKEKIDVKAVSGQINIIDEYYDFNYERPRFQADLAKVNINDKDVVRGKVTLGIYAKTEQGNTIRMWITLDDSDMVLIKYDDEIELSSIADFMYFETGSNPRRFAGRLHDVYLKITKDKVYLNTQNPSLPLDVELDVSEFK